MRVWRRLEQALCELYENPRKLTGSGIQTESSFERHLIRHGIFLSKRVGYERYPNGPNKWPDFHLYDERSVLPIEIKSTRCQFIHLGQTWIRSEALYIARQHPHSVFMGLGKHMKTEEEDRLFREFYYAHKEFKEQWSRSQRFRSPNYWSSSMEIRYRLEEDKRLNMYQCLLEDLRRL